MKKFWELFEQSVITQSIITVMLVITVCVMFIMGRPIPSLLESLTMIVVGFWIGSKIGYTQGTRRVYSTVEKE